MQHNIQCILGVFFWSSVCCSDLLGSFRQLPILNPSCVSHAHNFFFHRVLRASRACLEKARLESSSRAVFRETPHETVPLKQDLGFIPMLSNPSTQLKFYAIGARVHQMGI